MSYVISQVQHTVDAGLEALAAGLAAEIAHSRLLVDLHRNGGFVIAEDTAECGGKWVALYTVSYAP
jgi:hypothetical protein